MKKDEIKQKRPFAPGIQWQLMLFIGGITLFTLLLVWGIITYALEPQYNRNIRAKLDSKAAAITALIDQSDAEISSRTYQGLYLNDEFWSGVSQTFRDKKINVDGNCVDFSDSTLRCLKAYESMYPCLLHESTGAFGGEFGYNLDTRIAIQLRQQLFQDGSLYQIVKIGSSMQMCVGRLSADGQYGVIVSASLAQITTAAEVLRAILGPVALILLVLDLLLAILFSRWFTNPIRKLSNGAQEIASGNYDVQIKVERRDEIGRLAEDFNHMAAEVKRSAQLEKDILANVSHDLRTPLTSISGNASNLLSNGNLFDTKTKEQMCMDIYDDAMWLIDLVENLLSVSRLEDGRMNLHISTELIDEVVAEALRHVDRRCAQYNLRVQNSEEYLLAQIDAKLIVQVLINLINNAIKYTPPGTEIDIAWERRGGWLQVSVSDTGPGVSDQAKPHIFDMFYSASDPIADSRRSMGLGLALCKSIINAHGGEIAVADRSPHGAIFTFSVPAGEVELHE
mgnify:CR=1 FL=1